jgi:DNA-binding NarL/FixJ family response regulator
MPNRVLIVDDHPVVRMGVRILLGLNPKWEVCGEAADGWHALREIVKLVPDVVILDVSMPVMNGFEVVQEIRRIAPSTKIVIFSIHDVAATAQQIGADGFVLKSSGVEALEATLERVFQGRAAANSSET